MEKSIINKIANILLLLTALLLIVAVIISMRRERETHQRLKRLCVLNEAVAMASLKKNASDV